MAFDSRKCLWFGTLESMQWVSTPLRGAESSPEAWGADGTLLNGGGWVAHSWGSHKTYTYEWPESSSREAAALMKSYRDGTYGRGLIYFVDPLIYDQNVLPARLADPSMALDNEGATLVYGVNPTSSATANWATKQLPIKGAVYNLATVASGFRGVEDATFVPIPEGYSLYLGAYYSKTGSGGIFVAPQNSDGTIGTPVALTEKTATDLETVTDVFTGLTGVWIWVGKTSSGAATVTARALIGKLLDNTYFISLSPFGTGFFGEYIFGGPVGTTPTFFGGNWVGGSGHSGVRFTGVPSFVSNGPEEGGRIGYAASFREVGSFVYG
jgi:hypothetical protein